MKTYLQEKLNDDQMSAVNSGVTATKQTATEQHITSTSNPHSVTKSQVGLGNVPNVATNDQTPTFSEAATRENISSGETLATLFGKIKKWFASFGSLAFLNSLSKSDVGLGNVDNTSDLSKPISTATQAALNGKQATINDLDTIRSGAEAGAAAAAEISSINAKISSQATSTNKLISASEMGDAIASVEAKQLYSTSSQGSFATKAALVAATTFYNADGTTATPTKNDVAYVLADETHSGKSAKYVVASVVGSTITWGFVITFSDTTFSQAQMDAINSNITDTKRQGYDSHVANGDIHVTAAQKTAWNNKQDALSYAIGEDADGIYIDI